MALVVDPGRYVVAVSGGVDSVVLLDMLAGLEAVELVVAHFDHGIRSDSAEDAAFVAELAAVRGLPFETRREELGPRASEALARERRYAFLREVATRHGAQLVTAHHADDVLETIAINVSRGTGWRGLAVLDSNIVRPLLGHTKAELLDYANEHKLIWREDSTNQSDVYLRNRLRRKMLSLDNGSKRELLALHAEQRRLKHEIHEELAHLNGDGGTTLPYSRYFFTHIEPTVAYELLAHLTERRLTRPQLAKALHAIKTYASGKTAQAGSGVTLTFTTRQFTITVVH